MTKYRLLACSKADSKCEAARMNKGGYFLVRNMALSQWLQRADLAAAENRGLIRKLCVAVCAASGRCWECV